MVGTTLLLLRLLIDDLDVDCLIHKYVDDTTLTESLFSTNPPIWNFISSSYDWAYKNDMEVNLSKTKEIVMRPPSKIRHLPPLQFPTVRIERVNSVKLLGINLNSEFSWKSHVEAITVVVG